MPNIEHSFIKMIQQNTIVEIQYKDCVQQLEGFCTFKRFHSEVVILRIDIVVVLYIFRHKILFLFNEFHMLNIIFFNSMMHNVIYLTMD